MPESAARSRLLTFLMFLFLALFGAGLGFWLDHRSPEKSWRRAVHGPREARAALWVELRRDHLIDGLDHEKTVSEVLALLDDPDLEIQEEAVSTVAAVEAPPLEAIPRLSKKRKAGEPPIQVKATTALGEVVRRGEPGRDEAIDALTPALEDPSPEIRRAAVIAVGEVIYRNGTSADPLRSGRPEDPALKLVAAHLNDPDITVRVESAYVLACNDRGDEAVPMLAAIAREQPKPDALNYVAERAIFALMVLAARSDEAVAALVSELGVVREGYPDRPRDALAWASRQSALARVRVRRLTSNALKAEDPSLRHNAAIVMGEIGAGGSAIPELLEALTDHSIEVRLKAIDALGDLGEVDPAIIPALEIAAKDENREIRHRAIQALETIEMDDML